MFVFLWQESATISTSMTSFLEAFFAFCVWQLDCCMMKVVVRLDLYFCVPFVYNTHNTVVGHGARGCPRGLGVGTARTMRATATAMGPGAIRIGSWEGGEGLQ